MRVAGYRPRPPREEPTVPAEAGPRLRWTITVRRWESHFVGGHGGNTYGWRVVAETPTTVYAPDKEGVTERVRAMFNAEMLREGYGSSKTEHWSHDWTLARVDEEGS